MKTTAVLMLILLLAATGAGAEDTNPFSLGYGILTSTGTDAKSPAPGALTAKYGFGTDKAFKPYIGAGLAYSPPPPESKPNDPATGMKTGVAYQLGFNYLLSENSSLNVDYKHLSITPDTRHGNNDTVPSLLGVGLNIRF